jgi:hypothetical protein
MSERKQPVGQVTANESRCSGDQTAGARFRNQVQHVRLNVKMRRAGSDVPLKGPAGAVRRPRSVKTYDLQNPSVSECFPG